MKEYCIAGAVFAAAALFAGGVLAAAAALFLLLFRRRSRRRILRERLFFYVTEAERLFGRGTGRLKFAYTVGRVCADAPPLTRRFLSFGRLSREIEEALSTAEKVWSEDLGVQLYLNRGTAPDEGVWRELTDGEGGQP